MSRFSTMVIFLLLTIIIPLESNAENVPEELEISWENEGGITFVVPSDQIFQFGIGINSVSTNEQIINLEIIGETNWGIDENTTITINYNDSTLLLHEGDIFILQPGDFANITVGVYVPDVINGYPLAETPYPFQLKITNSSGAFKTWDYSISLIPKYSFEIENITEINEINPSGNVMHQIEIRNTGNIVTEFQSEIFPLDENGNVILTNESNRFVKDGWNATLSGWMNALSLEPNESNIFKITVNAPYISSGKLSILVKIRTLQGGIVENIYLNSSIIINKNIKLEFEDNNCEDFVTKKKCILNLKLKNEGNFIDELQNTNCSTNSNFIGFNLIGTTIENTAPTYILLTEDNQEINIERNEIIELKFEIIFQPPSEGINAGTNGIITCNYFSNKSEILNLTQLQITIIDFLEIESSEISEKWVEDNKLYISVEIKNKGNSPESFSISISVSHDENHNLIIPTNAIYDENSSRIRSYELLDVQPNESFNVTGWFNLPSQGIEDEITWISLDASTYSNSFTKTWKNELIIEGKGTDETNSSIQEEIAFYELRNYFNTYGYTLLAVIIATIMIFQAIKIRSKRINKKDNENIEKNGEWMSKFFERKKRIENVESQSISKAEFKQMFSNKTGNKEIPAITTFEKEILNDASQTIDRLNKKQSEEELNSLVEDLFEEFENDDSEFDY